MLRTLLVSLAALALISSGCGGDDDSEGSAPEVSASDSAAETTAEPTATPETTDPPASVPMGQSGEEEESDASSDESDPEAKWDDHSWTEVVDGAPWGGRAGLRVVELDGALFLMGGRTPRQSTLPGDSDIFSDVWRSDDLGETWELVVESGQDDVWAPRAYFQAVVNEGAIYVLGGQDYGLEPNPFCALLEQGLEPPPELGIDPDAPCPEFLPTSQFFNDVWRSEDGTTWELVTEAAPWSPRAGLSIGSVDGWLYVLGGSQNDDASIIGPNGPQRIYYNDVWRSADGANWELVTEAAPWEPRAGAATAVRDGKLWVFGGEDGFACSPVPDCDPPYFNDVWTLEGSDWELVTDAAGWSPRPGHQCELLDGHFVCFGGFGLVENPTDMWASLDGADWTLLAASAWDVSSPDEVKYDFDSLVVETPDGEVIMTAGGDRETFDFADPENYLRVDDDVWIFGAQ